MPDKINQLPVTLLTGAALLIIGGAALTNPAWMDALWYSRSGIGAGEWWRLVTGHLVHHSAVHLLLNLLAFMVLGGWLERSIGSGRLAALLCVLMPGIGIGLYVWVPDMGFYAGVSALNYGMFAWLVLDSRGQRPLLDGHPRLRWIGFSLLVLVCLLQWRSGLSLVPAGGALTVVAWQAHLLAIGLVVSVIGRIPQRLWGAFQHSTSLSKQ